MATTNLPNVKTLCEILPKGTEGGKEFGRLLHLLLFYQARHLGHQLTLFDDRSGDWNGLDSFERGGMLLTNRIGYQYKLFPSPFSDQHRQEIKKSLIKAIDKHEQSQIILWVMVTCDELVESGRRRNGGDVTWFDKLKEDLKPPFEIEHWGHTKLLALFLETPALCLRYYPELMTDGVRTTQSIKGQTLSYISNMKTKYGRIEFVGMSVREEKAARGLKIENIYIPLKAIPEKADEKDVNLTRTDPVRFLAPGQNTVVLGDPGAGKSTLLHFLALIGQSEPLQKRFQTAKDDRLPILVVLRKYADALKGNPNLSVIDYVIQTVRADFNLVDIDQLFFEYYLYSSQAILLFDGMDELPDSTFKLMIRDRITSLTVTYPGNTIVITSRIVGYEGAIRFDDAFTHMRLASLQLPEIEKFVQDWYEARLDHKQERQENISHLMGVIRNEENEAIRTLASNPLLLTIIVLVHRVDAILPDARVVLYQKCVETLLITWHAWKKSRGGEQAQAQNVAEDRMHRNRMEAIAYWMHQQAGKMVADQRAVVPHDELIKFLACYIKENEEHPPSAIRPVDRAEEFLTFVKARAGLLVEAGDRLYSFVHLTFQEYLAASHLDVQSESGGDAELWNTLSPILNDPRWHEVIRLLVAGRKSIHSQKNLLQKIQTELEGQSTTHLALLAGGLLLDGITAAKSRAFFFVSTLLRHAMVEENDDLYHRILVQLRRWIEKEHPAQWDECLSLALQHAATSRQRIALFLTVLSIGQPLPLTLLDEAERDAPEEVEKIRYLLIPETWNGSYSAQWLQQIKEMHHIIIILSNESPVTNLMSTIYETLFFPLGNELLTEYTARTILQNLLVDIGGISGPFSDIIWNSINISWDKENISGIDSFMSFGRIGDNSKNYTSISNKIRQTAKTDMRKNKIDRGLLNAKEIAVLIERKDDNETLIITKKGKAFNYQSTMKDDISWKELISFDKKSAIVVNPLIDLLELSPASAWREALRVHWMPRIPQRLTPFHPTTWENTLNAARTSSLTEVDIYHITCQLLLDLWWSARLSHPEQSHSIFAELAELTRHHPSPLLRLLHALRDGLFGNESRVNEAVSMLIHPEPELRSLLNDIGLKFSEKVVNLDSRPTPSGKRIRARNSVGKPEQ
ncbi:MAG: NACHT domain-containing protein [Magnetococcales bacterium]|nr:NACHT domain-containing protein [Magnetococcales bacterium]